MDDDIYHLSSTVRSEVIDTLMSRLCTHYTFPDVASEMVVMLQKRRGEYDVISDGKLFAAILTTHLREVSHASHLLVSYEAQEVDAEEGGAFFANRRDIGEICNYGFEKVERLTGNIGYLCINAFFSPTFAFRVLMNALDFIARTNALIIDLRNASGGDLAMLKYLASYFFQSEPVHLNDISWRDSTQQYWTLPYVPGQRYATKPLSILTSHRTSSIAEAFAYDLQSRRRATIVGEVTAGEANLLERFHLGAHFASLIPVGYITDPVTGGNWEDVGVQPDVEVAQEQALQAAYTLVSKIISSKRDTIRASI